MLAHGGEPRLTRATEQDASGNDPQRERQAGNMVRMTLFSCWISSGLVR
jgi:hypothetical protein